jgi:hypothetical protein
MALHEGRQLRNALSSSALANPRKRAVRKRIPCASPWLLEAPTSLHLKGVEMLAIAVMVCLGVANFSFQAFQVTPDYVEALERTWFQLTAVLIYAAWIRFFRG